MNSNLNTPSQQPGQQMPGTGQQVLQGSNLGLGQQTPGTGQQVLQGSNISLGSPGFYPRPPPGNPPGWKPPDPIMGTCIETYKGSKSYHLLFGGKPKADWSGIEDPDSRTSSDLQFRSLDPVAGQKSTVYRQKGLSKKFDPKQNLNDFADSVWDHLTKYGLDTVSYLPDPRDRSKALCVVKKHSQYTADMEKVTEIAKSLQSKFDSWDKKHDKEAKTFLLDSLSDSLLKGFKPFHNKDKDTFAMTWLKLVFYLVTSTTDTYDKLKDDIRRITPQEFPGQDIEKMSAKYLELTEILVNAGYFDTSLIMNMVDGFLDASPDDKGTFHFSMNTLKKKVEDIERKTVFMSKQEQFEEFAKNSVSVSDVCLQAVREYKLLKKKNKWEPAKLPKDRHTPASQTINVAAINNLIASLSDQQVNTNSQLSKSKSNKKGCYNCGSPDHLAKDCPEPKKTEGERKKLRHKSMAGTWRLKKPGNGESKTKQVGGRTYHWCGKCGNWTATHTESEHGKGRTKKKSYSKKGAKKKVSFSPETNLTTIDPEVWMAAFHEEEQNNINMLDILKYAYFVLTLAIILGLPVPTITNFMSFYEHTNNLWTVIGAYFSSGIEYFKSILTALSCLSGPILWILLGYLACKFPVWERRRARPLILATPREERRRSRSSSQVRYKLKSARDHNLSPKYPHRLRKENKFYTRDQTPTSSQRYQQTSLDNWVSNCSPCNNRHNKAFNKKHWHKCMKPYVSPTSSFSSPSSSHKSKGGYCSKRKYDSKGGHYSKRKPDSGWTRIGKKHYTNDYLNRIDDLNRKAKGSISSSNLTSSPNDSFYDYSQRPRSCKKQSYVPIGLQTARDSPNNNLTKSQSRRMHDTARAVLLTGASLNQAIRQTANNIALLSPSRFRTALASTRASSQFPVVWDSGASICVTPDRNDFINYKNTPDVKTVKGVNGNSSPVVGQGMVEWSVYDANGSLRKFKLPAYHIPNCKTRLISTSSLLNTYQGEHITIDGNSLKLSGIQGDPERSQVVVFNNPLTLLPTTTAYISKDTDLPSRTLNNIVSTVSDHNDNLTEAQKELLRWHQRLGHLDFNKVKHLLRTGVLSHTDKYRSLHTAASKVQHAPKCAACLFGKQTITSAPGKVVKVIKDRAGILRSGNLLPGQEVSVDHFISSVRGRLFEGYNRGRIEDRYVGGCIFVDHASSYIHIEFQSSLSSHATLTAKMEYEKHCRDAGVVPQKYMSDNGKSFASREFSEHLSNFYQISKFAGVGAHHHNAQAERAIRTIMSIARTMMIHAGIYWSNVADSTLWPMAVKHACFLYNHVPNHTTGLSPSDLFTRTRWPQKKFLDIHVWGCPVYVLEKSLQDGKKIPKWKPRSSRAIYMGISHKHASSVPLVLNTSTGAITPQFHIVFDDWFATVGSDHDSLPDFSSDEWNKMFGSSKYQYVIEEEQEDNDQTDDYIETLKSQLKSDQISDAQDIVLPPKPLDTQEPATIAKPRTEDTSPVKVQSQSSILPKDTTNQREPESIVEPELKRSESPIQEMKKESSPQRKQSRKVKKSSKSSELEKLGLGPRVGRRRERKPTTRLTYYSENDSSHGLQPFNMYRREIDEHNVYYVYMTPEYYVLMSSSKEANPDLFSYDEAMSSEHRSEWIKAAIKEITALEKFGCWVEVPIESATTKVLPGTWVFKVKRAPDGTFKKFKARYCIRGDLQEGEFETYAPVVQFSSVRLFLAWSLMLGWYTCSIDFSNAFIQATLKDDTYIHLPRGFSGSGTKKTCLKLNRSLYGLAVAPRLWYQHLWKALKELGLVASKHDPCLLFRKDLIVICYVDDLGIQAPNKKIVDELIDQLRKKGFDLTFEGSFTEYLGIQYTKISETEIEMTQEGLIQKILEATGMEDCNSNRTPTTKEALGSDESGPPMEDAWNYRSVVGMLLYLSTNTRPDIAFAVSQVARFSHNPKKSHASAVKTLIRYLAGTKKRGVIYKRPKTLQLDCYVDADFAGLYGREPPENPTSVKSRTGYIISVGGCYITCKSQLQSTIALSTSEAEYGALSQAMRAVIPIRETLLEMIKAVDMVDVKNNAPFGTRDNLCSFKTVIHEDNSAALSLAVNQKVTSRTKHWCVKFHFFWSYVNDEKNNTQCVKVESKNQKADFLTKGLTKDNFEHCRFLNQGW